jgi:hypothetical protein
MQLSGLGGPGWGKVKAAISSTGTGVTVLGTESSMGAAKAGSVPHGGGAFYYSVGGTTGTTLPLGPIPRMVGKLVLTRYAHIKR